MKKLAMKVDLMGKTLTHSLQRKLIYFMDDLKIHRSVLSL